MLRFLTLLIGSISALSAAVLPEQFAEFKKISSSAVQIEDRPIWDEYGLEDSERGEFSAGTRKISVTAYRLKDPTGAFAAMQWQRGSGVKPVMHNNYVLSFTGELKPAERDALYAGLPKVVVSSPPPLSAYLPAKGKVANSERYILGPASLARFEPRISADLAAFQLGPEGQLSAYRIGGREVQLAVFSYPTPQMAAVRIKALQAIPDASVRRSGPIAAVAFSKGPEAEALIGQINYQPKLSWTEHVPKDTPQDAAKMILAILTLAGVLIATSVLLGFALGGARFALGKFGIQTADQSLITLKLSDK